MPDKCSNFGLPHRGGGGVLNQVQEDREVVIRQSESTVISVTVLYDRPRDAGRGSYVHTFPVLSTGCSVHSAYGSQ